MTEFLFYVADDHKRHSNGEKVEGEGGFTFHFTMTDIKGKLMKEFSFVVSNSAVFLSTQVYPSHYDILLFHNYRERAYLCNPSTQQVLPLPPFSPCAHLDSSSCSSLGFGYLPSTHEYKVVHLFYTKSRPPSSFSISCEIYSMVGANFNSTSSWRMIETKCPHPIDGSFAACVGEVLHWMPDYDQFEPPHVAIVSFDLKAEEFRTMPISKRFLEEINGSGGRGDPCLKELGGKLFLINGREFLEDSDLKMGLWMVKDYELGIWEKAYTINLGQLENVADIYAIPGELLAIEPVGYVTESDDELMLSAFGREGNRIIYYNVTTKCFRIIQVERPMTHFGFFKPEFCGSHRRSN